jgi:hypothetical protein
LDGNVCQEDEMIAWKWNRLIATMKLDIIDSESEYDDEEEEEVKNNKHGREDPENIYFMRRQGRRN